MGIENEQSVAAETDEVVTPPTEESGAQDLDSLLNEFEAGTTAAADTGTAAVDTGTSSTSEPGEQPEDVKAAVDYVKNMQEQESKRNTDTAISDAVTSIKEGLTQTLPDMAVKGIIYEMAESNPKFLTAFQQRAQNPEAWGKVLKAVAGNINTEMGNAPDPGLTNDRNALASAVRNASSAAPAADTAPNWGAMSDADLAEQKRQATRAAR